MILYTKIQKHNAKTVICYVNITCMFCDVFCVTLRNGEKGEIVEIRNSEKVGPDQ